VAGVGCGDQHVSAGPRAAGLISPTLPDADPDRLVQAAYG
jgi:hypothetical protein